MNLEVRPALLSDAAAIGSITHQAFTLYAHDLGLPVPVAALAETPKVVEEEIKTKHVLLGLLEGEPIASIRFAYFGNIAYISRFGVLPGVQKSGIGKELLAAVCRQCEKDGIAAIALHTCTKMMPQVRFYYGQGFYIHSTTHNRGYVRGLFLKELSSYKESPVDLSLVSGM